MLKKRRLVTAVCFLFIMTLAACSGSVEEAEETVADEVEATGSESAGNDILPTPITGLKVPPTRSGANELDLYFLVQPALSEMVDLTAVSQWLAAQSDSVEAHFGLRLMRENEVVADFTSDFDTLTAVLDQTPSVITPVANPEAIVADTIIIPDWRADADRRLFIFINEDLSSLTDSDFELIISTAVANNMAIYPFLLGEFPTEAQLQWQMLAEVTNGRFTIFQNTTVTAAEWEQAIQEALDQSFEN